MKYSLNFITDYRQFYLEDEYPAGNTGSENFWSSQAFEDRLAVENGILGIGIGNDEGIVNCDLEILDKKSLKTNFDNYSHVVEASLQLHSGKLSVIDCPHGNVELKIDVEPADYRVRVYSNKLETAFDENPKDYYQIEMWQEVYSERIVLKRYLE